VVKLPPVIGGGQVTAELESSDRKISQPGEVLAFQLDVGMGLYLAERGIGGQVRITSSLPGHRDHLWDDRKRLPTSVAAADLYGQNVQIVDMNALNAALAVNRWKRHVGIYADLEGEHFSLYASDGNDITNEDQ